MLFYERSEVSECYILIMLLNLTKELETALSCEVKVVHPARYPFPSTSLKYPDYHQTYRNAQKLALLPFTLALQSSWDACLV